MTWNWQSPDWPNFKWDRSRISGAEEQFLLGAGVAIGAVKHLGEDDHKQLLVESCASLDWRLPTNVASCPRNRALPR
jgi:hypothetical protein